MADDGIMEIHGCYVRKADGNSLMFQVSEYSGSIWFEPIYSQVKLTPAQARYLAKQLNRLADRIDARLDPVTLTPEDAKAIGSRGGHAAAASMTAQQRTERARKGAEARWKKADAK